MGTAADRRIVVAIITAGLLAACAPAVAVPMMPQAKPAAVSSATTAGALNWRTPLVTMQGFAKSLLSPAAPSLWGRLSPELRQVVGSEQGLRELGDGFGPEARLHGEQVFPDGGRWLYMRRAEFARTSGIFEVTVVAREDGEIGTLSVRPSGPYAPEAASPHLKYRTKTPLRLPFDGEWYVFWGGRTVARNYHAAHVDQRFAYDLAVVRNGSTHRGDGTKNSDYHCYGLPLLAPGDGVITLAVDRYPDNPPGKTRPADHAAGNHVGIDHGNGEFSMLCHMQPGSVAVKVGQRVKAGDKLGLTGSSGNTSEPHLHYHLQTTGTFFKGEGLPPQFQNYRANGERVSRGEPVQGQFIRPDGP